MVRDQYGNTALNTALMLAANKGSAECVAALLAVDGIDVNVTNLVRCIQSPQPHVPRIGALRQRQALELLWPIATSVPRAKWVHVRCAD